MNKKIKIIDLFNKKANNEKMPKKFKYKNYIFELDDVNEYTIDKEKQVAFTELIQFNLNNLNDEIEILEDNTEEIDELNAYKLMESPYMANLLKEQRYDKFMELLKQSEVEIADKLIKLTWVVKEMRKEIKCIELD